MMRQQYLALIILLIVSFSTATPLVVKPQTIAPLIVDSTAEPNEPQKANEVVDIVQDAQEEQSTISSSDDSEHSTSELESESEDELAQSQEQAVQQEDDVEISEEEGVVQDTDAMFLSQEEFETLDQETQLALLQSQLGSDDQQVQDQASSVQDKTIDSIAGNLAFQTYHKNFRTGALIKWQPKTIPGLKGHHLEVVGNTFSDNGAQVNYVLWDKTTDIVYIVFRGTGADVNWKYNFMVERVPCTVCKSTCPTCHVGEGFQQLFMSVQSKIAAAVKSIPNAASKQFVITGHSQGAALSVLEGYDLAANQGIKNIRVVSMGGPRVGDEAFAKSYDRLVPNTVRYVERYHLAKCPNRGWWGRLAALTSDINLFRKYAGGDRSPAMFDPNKEDVADEDVQDDDSDYFTTVASNPNQQDIQDSYAQRATMAVSKLFDQHAQGAQLVNQVFENLNTHEEKHNNMMANARNMWFNVDQNDDEQVNDVENTIRTYSQAHFDDLTDYVSQEQANIEHHLQELKDSDLPMSRGLKQSLSLCSQTLNMVHQYGQQHNQAIQQTPNLTDSDEKEILGMSPLEFTKFLGRAIQALTKNYDEWKQKYKNKPYVEGVDIVTTVPYIQMGYKHVGKVNYLVCPRACNDPCKCRGTLVAAALCHDPQYYAEALSE